MKSVFILLPWSVLILLGLTGSISSRCKNSYKILGSGVYCSVTVVDKDGIATRKTKAVVSEMLGWSTMSPEKWRSEVSTWSVMPKKFHTENYNGIKKKSK